MGQAKSSSLPMQCYSDAKSVEFDPDPQTQLEAFCEKTALTVQVSPQYLQCFQSVFQTANVHNQRTIRTSKAIVDSGADSHVGDGNAWLPLSPLSGPGVCYANIKGCDNSFKKANLPIIVAVTKTTDDEGKTWCICAKHLAFNANSTFTLLCPF